MTIRRLAFILAAPLLLASCMLTPGKFTSALDIRKDRSFTFTYVGEMIAVEDKSDTSECEADDKDCDPKAKAAEAAEKKAEEDAKLREIGEALSKEAGYRSVQYLGDRKYQVDYSVSGKLDRTFVYPFNSDIAAILPWIGIELRNDGTARVKAPAFGDDGQTNGLESASPFANSTKLRDGTFTLTTDAEIVMQNEEGGARQGPGGAKMMVWRVTPTSKAVPTAVVRVSK
jgi:hypothetical protein